MKNHRKYLEELYEEFKKYDNFDVIKESIMESSTKTIMSRNRTLEIFGLFSPDKFLEIPCGVSRGTITKSEKARTMKYYFNDKDKVIFLERYNTISKILCNYIAYFYYDKYTDIVIYDRNKEISDISRIEYENKTIKNYIMVYGHMGYSDNEFHFLDNNKLLFKKIYYDLFDKNEVNIKIIEDIYDISHLVNCD